MDKTIHGLSDEAAEAALMASFEPEGDGEGAPSDADDQEEFEPNPEDLDDGEQPEEGDDRGEEEAEEGAEEPEDGEEHDDASQAPAEINDDHELTVQVNGEAQKFTVGQLKRLAGQEASLTRKSQEADLVGGRAAAALQTAVETIMDDLKPYQGVDWLVLQQQMEPAEFQWHRENAGRLQGKYQKLVGAAQNFDQAFAQRRQTSDADAAKAALDELKADIPDWSEDQYTDILNYGASQGLDRAELASVTNPKVIKIIRKAMLQDKAAKVVTNKVKTTPTKVIKGNKSSNGTAPAINVKKATQRLAKTGSDDAAMAVLMGRWA